MTPGGSHRIRSQDEAFRLKSGLFSGEDRGKSFDVLCGDYVTETKLNRFGKELVADLK